VEKTQGRTFGQKNLRPYNMVVVAGLCEDAWQHQKWEVFMLSNQQICKMGAATAEFNKGF
jgi:hypothetical protein